MQKLLKKKQLFLLFLILKAWHRNLTFAVYVLDSSKCLCYRIAAAEIHWCCQVSIRTNKNEPTAVLASLCAYTQWGFRLNAHVSSLRCWQRRCSPADVCSPSWLSWLAFAKCKVKLGLMGMSSVCNYNSSYEPHGGAIGEVRGHQHYEYMLFRNHECHYKILCQSIRVEM